MTINKKIIYSILTLFVLLLLTSITSASSDNNFENSTNIVKEKNIDELSISKKTIIKEEKDTAQIKSDSNTKHKTKTSLNTYTNGSHIIMDAEVNSDIDVNEGYVIYKLNGATLKNNNNQNLKVNVVNSKATLSLSVSKYKNLYPTSEAVYSGSNIFEKSRIKVNNNLIKHTTGTLLNTYTNATHIIMDANVDSDIPVYNGYVIYKLNKRTLKDSNNENYKVNVINSKAILALPLSDYANIYSNSEAVYSGSPMFSNSRTFNNEELYAKINPKITIITNQSSYYPGENVEFKILLSSDITNNFKNGKAIIKINGQTFEENNKAVVYRIKGNSVNISIPLPKGLKENYVNITVVSVGSNYNSVESVKKIYLDPLKTKIVVKKFFIDNNNYCIVNATIKDIYGDNVIGKRFVDFLVDNNKVRINNKSKVYPIRNGKINIKVPLDQYKKGLHNLQLKLRSDNAYNSSATKIYKKNITEKYITKIIIDTPQKIKTSSNTNLRIYVTYNDSSILKTVNGGKISLKINNQLLTSDVKYGKAIISYKIPDKTGKYTIKAKYNGINDLKDSSQNREIIVTSDSISSSESSILGNKDPKTQRISLVNGVPNLIYMTNYVWADENANYTLSKSQIEEVFKQDSYSLYLNKHMSKYVAFKTINESDVYHVLKREKWNVIEKAVNKIRVKTSKGVIPNNITVSLKGKQYTYGETRAIQSTEYTCGPTAASVCTQALRNYVNEDTLAVDFKTYSNRGTYASYIPNAMKKYGMSAVYTYKSNFDNVLNKLSEGGYAFIFYGVNHYVSIIDISKDKTKVLVSNSYGNYELGGGKIPNGWVSVSVMKNKFSKDSFAGLLMSLDYSLSSTTKTRVNNLYNNFGTNYIRKNTNEELNV